MKEEKTPTFKEEYEFSKQALARLEVNMDYLVKLNLIMKNDGCISNPNVLKLIIDLIECDGYSVAKLIKPLTRAYRRAIGRKKVVVRSYGILVGEKEEKREARNEEGEKRTDDR